MRTDMAGNPQLDPNIIHRLLEAHAKLEETHRMLEKANETLSNFNTTLMIMNQRLRASNTRLESITTFERALSFSLGPLSSFTAQRTIMSII